MSLNEACEILGVSRRKLSLMRDNGEIRCPTIGTRVLVPVSEITRLLGEG